MLQFLHREIHPIKFPDHNNFLRKIKIPRCKINILSYYRTAVYKIKYT